MLKSHGSRARLSAAVSASLLCLAVLPAVSSAAPAPISNLVLNAYQAGKGANTKPVTTKKKLAKHGLYVATIQGTLSYYAAIDYTAIQLPFAVMCGTPASAPMYSAPGGSGPVGNDAEFIFAEPTTEATCAAKTLPVHWYNVQATVGGKWEHPKLLSEGALNAPTANHSYEYALVGKHKRASFRLTDPDTQDNYGSLHITVRPAVSGDCAGEKWKAFYFLTRSSCEKATHHKGAAPAARRAINPITIDQGPIGRVVRATDVPGALDIEQPSGALNASQFLAATKLKGASAHEASLTLKADGFLSAAISEFATSGPTVTSTTLKLGTPAQAEAALTAWGTIASKGQAPAGTKAVLAPDAAFRRALVVTFTPAAAANLGGVEVLVAEGDYLYMLRSVQKPDAVSQGTTEQLLGAVVARG